MLSSQCNKSEPARDKASRSSQYLPRFAFLSLVRHKLGKCDSLFLFFPPAWRLARRCGEGKRKKLPALPEKRADAFFLIEMRDGCRSPERRKETCRENKQHRRERQRWLHSVHATRRTASDCHRVGGHSAVLVTRSRCQRRTAVVGPGRPSGEEGKVPAVDSRLGHRFAPERQKKDLFDFSSMAHSTAYCLEARS